MNEMQAARGNRLASLVVGTLSFVITLPQTVVAVIMGSSTLLADSLAMWSDFGAYLIGILAFHVLVQNMDSPGQSKRRLVWYDIIASSAGLLLLLASCTYITLRAVRDLKINKANATDNDLDIDYDPRIVMLFASCGAIIDIASLFVILYFSR